MYNSRLQPVSHVTSKNGTLLSLLYSYGPTDATNDGNPRSQTISGGYVNGSFGQSYNYDSTAWDQRTKAGWSQTYAYDVRGGTGR